MADRDLCGCTLGEFVLRERIGEGDIATTYRAEQPLLGRDVVVKVLRQGHDDLALQRFRREIQLASRFDHPYAAQLYAFGVDARSGLPWIAMELVHGITLERWLKKHGPMPLVPFVPFFEGITHVVQAAHYRGIVHRDLTSSKVMVVESAGRLFPKLLDLGINRLIRGDADMGSPAYRSPEQWSNVVSVSPATDVYALGVVAYEALTGHLPFLANTPEEYCQRHCHADVPRLGSPDLDRILQRALAKLPEDRQPSVLELAAELRTALRASLREQPRSSARRWEYRRRAPGLVRRGDAAVNLALRARAPSHGRGELERAFAAARPRGARRGVWVQRSLTLLASILLCIVSGIFQYLATDERRLRDR
jgi:eukaryotic-like serine/threonine-protein kinase